MGGHRLCRYAAPARRMRESRPVSCKSFDLALGQLEAGRSSRSAPRPRESTARTSAESSTQVTADLFAQAVDTRTRLGCRMAIGDAPMGDPGSPVRFAARDVAAAGIRGADAPCGRPVDSSLRRATSDRCTRARGGLPARGADGLGTRRRLRVSRRRPTTKHDVVVLVGPSHVSSPSMASAVATGAFETPLGRLPIDAALGAEAPRRDTARARRPGGARTGALAGAAAVSRRGSSPTCRSCRCSSAISGRATVEALGDALAHVARGRELLLLASSDLSHYQDRRPRRALDAAVIEHVERGDPGAFKRVSRWIPLTRVAAGPSLPSCGPPVRSGRPVPACSATRIPATSPATQGRWWAT